MRALTAEQLRRVAPMQVTVELMKTVFSLYSAGQTISPLRTVIEIPDSGDVSLFMPAFVPENDLTDAASGAKIVSVYPENPGQGLPTIHAIVILLDTATGQPLGLIEGGALTALRTGAVAGAATDLMARANSTRLAIIGAGAQGVTQAAAVCAVRDINTIAVYDRDTSTQDTYAERLAVWNERAASRVEIVETVAEALATADIVCTATTSKTPVFDDTLLQPGTHINAVGSFTPEMQELPLATILRARIVVDSIEAVLHEAGDFIIPIKAGDFSDRDLTIELGAIVNEEAAGRTHDEQITLFKSVGNAIQDMIVARYAIERAESEGIGQAVDLL